MQHETTQGDKSLKIHLNRVIFYVILILETRLIKEDLEQCLFEVLAATPSFSFIYLFSNHPPKLLQDITPVISGITWNRHYLITLENVVIPM